MFINNRILVFFIFIISIIIVSCKKTTIIQQIIIESKEDSVAPSAKRINVDKLGAKGDGLTDDSPFIIKAIDSVGDGGVIVFSGGKTYLVAHTLYFKKNQTFTGYGATIKRADETISTLAASLSPISQELTLDSIPSDWQVGDLVHLFSGQTISETTNSRKIKKIVENTITLEEAFGNLAKGPTPTNYPVKSKIRRVYSLFEGPQFPEALPATFLGFSLDGNKANNSANYYWALNASIGVFGYGSVIRDCVFVDIPNENIVTSGSNIINCYAHNLNGSFAHLSSATHLGADIQGTTISSNYVDGICLAGLSANGHNEGAISLSWYPGKLIVTNNQFYNGSESTIEFANADSNSNTMIVTNNIFKSFKNIVTTIPNTFNGQKIDERLISNNLFIDCGVNNFSPFSTYSDKINFTNNYAFGNTVIIY